MPFFSGSFINTSLERRAKPILTLHDGRRHFNLSGIRTCVHPHGSSALYHCATGADIFYFLYSHMYTVYKSIDIDMVEVSLYRHIHPNPHSHPSFYLLFSLTLSGCTLSTAFLYIFFTPAGVTSWCIPHSFHRSSPSHNTVCREHSNARMFFSLPSVHSRTWGARKWNPLCNYVFYKDESQYSLHFLDWGCL